jgi:hypothetical protein
MKHKLLSLLFSAVVIFGVVSAFSTPGTAAQLSKAADHLGGNGFGAVVVGLPELAVGYRQVVNSGGTSNFVANYPALNPSGQLAAAQAEAAKQKRRADKAQRDLANAKAQARKPAVPQASQH